MKYIPVKFVHHMHAMRGQAMLEYALIFAAIVLLTLFGNTLLTRVHGTAESQRDQAIQKILGPGGGGATP